MQKVVVLGTGGTIAGLRDDPQDPSSYQAGQVAVADLVSQAHVGSEVEIETRQIAQVDSKDMSLGVWSALLLAIEECLRDEQVIGVLITHGTDTMEESAYLLARLIEQPPKPVVLTGAMQPFDAPNSDGAKNLQDAIEVIQSMATARLGCVCVVIHGVVHSPFTVQKLNLQSEHPFYSHAPLTQGSVQQPTPLAPLREQSLSLAQDLSHARARLDRIEWGLAPSLQQFCAAGVLPRVEIVLSHSAMTAPTVVHTLLNEFKSETQGHLPSPQRLQGLVLVGPGAGNLHHALHEPVLELMRLGVRVVVTHRAPWGIGGKGGKGVRLECEPKTDFTLSPVECPTVELSVSELSPVKARIALMLSLML